MSRKGVRGFLAAKVLDNFMFGYVYGVRQNLPSVSIEKAIVQFKKTFAVPDDTMSTLGAKRQYIRMEEQFINYLKTPDADDSVDAMGN